VDVSQLSADERATLGDACWEVFRHHFGGLDKALVIEKLFFRSGEAKLLLCHDSEDRLVGLSSYRRLVITVRGRKCVVLTIGMWSDLKYQGFGRRLLRWWVLQTIRDWLKSPLAPLFLAGFTTTPAPYRMVMQNTFIAYPRETRTSLCGRSRPSKPPQLFVELMEEVARQNEMVPVEGRPLVFRDSHLPVLHLNPEKLASSPTIRQDSTYPHFVRLNPDWSKGDMLATGIPLTLGNLALTLLMRTLRWLRGAWRKPKQGDDGEAA
jgi:hypothetical protein